MPSTFFLFAALLHLLCYLISRCWISGALWNLKTTARVGEMWWRDKCTRWGVDSRLKYTGRGNYITGEGTCEDNHKVMTCLSKSWDFIVVSEKKQHFLLFLSFSSPCWSLTMTGEMWKRKHAVKPRVGSSMAQITSSQVGGISFHPKNMGIRWERNRIHQVQMQRGTSKIMDPVNHHAVALQLQYHNHVYRSYNVEELSEISLFKVKQKDMDDLFMYLGLAALSHSCLEGQLECRSSYAEPVKFCIIWLWFLVS